MTSAKRNTPRTENIYKKSSKSPPIFVRAGIVTITVSKITFIYLDFLIYLNMRAIRSARMKVVDAPKSTFKMIDIILDKIDVTTITKSNQFSVSLKYTFAPYPITFDMHSNINITANE